MQKKMVCTASELYKVIHLERLNAKVILHLHHPDCLHIVYVYISSCPE